VVYRACYIIEYGGKAWVYRMVSGKSLLSPSADDPADEWLALKHYSTLGEWNSFGYLLNPLGYVIAVENQTVCFGGRVWVAIRFALAVCIGLDHINR